MVKKGYYGNESFGLVRDRIKVRPIGLYSTTMIPTGAIVLNVLHDYLGQGYTVYVDNYYNSVKLTKQFKINKTYICETLTAYKNGNPTYVTKKQLKRGK